MKKKKEPVRTLLFRISPEGSPRIWRIVELTENQTLHHLHLALHGAFGLKGKHLYLFCLSGKHWDTDTEYGGPGSGSSRKANKAQLGKILLERGRVFSYVYDFREEQRFSIEWIDEGQTEPKVSYPRVLEGKGELPEPKTPLTELLPPPAKSLVQKLKPVLEVWTLNRAKPRGPKDLQGALELVSSLEKLLEEGGRETWSILEAATDYLLVDWLLSLPRDLVRRNLGEEALRICDTFAPYADEIYFICEKALVFAALGKSEQAIEQVRAAMTRAPEETRVTAKVAEVFWKLGEIGHAERLFRKALDLASEDINEREKILQKLLVMFEENERTEEAAELVQAEMDRG